MKRATKIYKTPEPRPQIEVSKEQRIFKLAKWNHSNLGWQGGGVSLIWEKFFTMEKLAKMYAWADNGKGFIWNNYSSPDLLSHGYTIEKITVVADLPEFVEMKKGMGFRIKEMG